MLRSGLFFLINFQLAWGLLVSVNGFTKYNLNVIHGMLSLIMAGLLVLPTLRRLHWFTIVLIFFLIDPQIAHYFTGSATTVSLSDLPRRIFPFLMAFTIVQSNCKITWNDMVSWHRNFVIFSIIPQLFFLYSVVTGDVFIVNYHYGYQRYIGCFSGPHQAAFYFLLNSVSILMLILNGRLPKVVKIIVYFDLGMSLTFLYLTGTRTAVVGILLYFLYLLFHYKGHNQRAKKFSIVLMAAFLIRYSIVLFTDLVRYLSGSTSLILVGGGRLLIWTYGFKEWIKGGYLEILFGQGYGSDQIFNSGSGLLRAHNDLLTIAFESGIVGLCLYLGSMLWFMRIISNRIKRRKEPWMHWIVGLGWVAIFTNLISNSFYLRVFPGTYLWMWIAITYVYAVRRPHSPSEEQGQERSRTPALGALQDNR